MALPLVRYFIINYNACGLKSNVSNYPIFNVMLSGGGTTLTELINLLKKNGNIVGLEYGKRVATHLERVANISVRNVMKTCPINGFMYFYKIAVILS